MSEDPYRNPFEPQPPEPNKPVHPLLVQRQAAERTPGQQPPQQRIEQTQQRIPQQRIAIPRSKPYLTYTLLGINIIVFLVDMLLGGQLIALGGKLNPAIIAGEYWRFITPIFLHAGIIHLGFNSYFLYIVGPQVEGTFGTLRFALVYFVAGLAGSVASYALTPNPQIPSIGASGALFGVIGALIPFMYLNKDVLSGARQRIMSIAQVIGINLLIGLAPGIDNWGHIGGLLGGLAVAFFATPRYVKKASIEKSPLVEDSNYLVYSVEDETEPIGAFIAAIAIAGAVSMLAVYLVSIGFNAA